LRKELGDLDLADAHALLGQWDEAVKLLEKVLDAPNVSVVVMDEHALLWLQQGDPQGYRKFCASMMKRFGKSTDAVVANGAAWICSLGPDALPDLKPAVECARLAVRTSPKDAGSRNTFGAILYRAGQYREAVTELNESVKLNTSGGTAFDFLFLAMAYRRLVKADESRTALAQAKQTRDKNPPVFWTEELELELLLREAESLIPAPDAKEKK
jgi:tetratricopeptide (TPR) repeat protein